MMVIHTSHMDKKYVQFDSYVQLGLTDANLKISVTKMWIYLYFWNIKIFMEYNKVHTCRNSGMIIPSGSRVIRLK